MQLLLATTKLDEVLKFFTHQGLKDQKKFSEMGKRKASLRKSLDELTTKDAFDSYTGKGILSMYENDLGSAISNFRAAYNYTNKSVIASLNLANSLLIQGSHPEAINIYLETIKKAQNDEMIFSDIFKSLITYCYLDEVRVLMESAPSIKLTSIQESELESAINAVRFLEHFEVSIEIYRIYRFALESILFKYFSITTNFTDELVFDKTRGFLSNIFYLPLDCNDVNAETLIGEMNDELQSLILKLRNEKFLYKKLEFRKMSEHLSCFFSIDFQQSTSTRGAA